MVARRGAFHPTERGRGRPPGGGPVPRPLSNECARRRPALAAPARVRQPGSSLLAGRKPGPPQVLLRQVYRRDACFWEREQQDGAPEPEDSDGRDGVTSRQGGGRRQEGRPRPQALLRAAP